MIAFLHAVMTYIAIQEYLDRKVADWMEQVGDEQYLAGIKPD